MEKPKSSLKQIPQVEKLLQEKQIKPFTSSLGRGLTTEIIRKEINSFRKKIKKETKISPKDLISLIVKQCQKKEQEKIQRVINATGIILHTNLGRAPLSKEIYENLEELFSGYSNLEFHLPSQKRGKRGGLAEDLICHLTKAESALIVNNNASSVFLILNALAKRKKVLVSRSELVQIGGGFRIPDIMVSSGAKLVEVGTTNITSLKDYASKIDEKTCMILSVHQSNYKIEGFTKKPSLKEISSLKKDNLFLVRDLGSGNLVFDKDLPNNFEPTISSELKQGVDLICFSGDKLLGGIQAGFILGKRELVDKLRQHPLMRILRIDKITYFILQETLLKFAKKEEKELPLWKIIFQKEKEISQKIDKILKELKPKEKSFLKKISSKAAFGGGSLPTIEINSYALQFNFPKIKAAQINSFFLENHPPLIGSIINGKFSLDFMTVLDKDLEDIVKAINLFFKKFF